MRTRFLMKRNRIVMRVAGLFFSRPLCNRVDGAVSPLRRFLWTLSWGFPPGGPISFSSAFLFFSSFSRLFSSFAFISGSRGFLSTFEYQMKLILCGMGRGMRVSGVKTGRTRCLLDGKAWSNWSAGRLLIGWWWCTKDAWTLATTYRMYVVIE